MYTVTRRGVKQIQEFYVYTQAEANSSRLVYQHWTKAQEGEWGLTDDGFVAECLKRKTYQGKDFVTFSFGSAWVNKSAKLEFLPFFNSGNYGGTSPRGWLEREMGKTRFKRTMHQMARMILSGHVDYDALGQLYRSDQKLPAVTVKKLFRREEVKQRVAQEVDKLMDEQGLTDSFVLLKLKKAIELAEAGSPNKYGDLVPDITNMLRAIEDLIELRNMKPKSRKVLDTATFDVSKQIEGEIEKEHQTLTLSREHELPSELLEVTDVDS